MSGKFALEAVLGQKCAWHTWVKIGRVSYLGTVCLYRPTNTKLHVDLKLTVSEKRMSALPLREYK